MERVISIVGSCRTNFSHVSVILNISVTHCSMMLPVGPSRGRQLMSLNMTSCGCISNALGIKFPKDSKRSSKRYSLICWGNVFILFDHYDLLTYGPHRRFTSSPLICDKSPHNKGPGSNDFITQI